MDNLEIVANAVTTFSSDGQFDAVAYARHLERLVEADVGVYVGSPGSGEVHTLSLDEFKRTCEIAVATAGDRVPVYSMTPELHTIPEILAFGETAVAAGVDVVQLFQYMGGHGTVPRREEQTAYWHEMLEAWKHPVAISIHGIAGYLCEPELMGELCSKYHNIETVYTYQSSLDYLVSLRQALPETVRLGGPPGPAGTNILFGSRVLTGAEQNVIPRTCRALIDGYVENDLEKIALMGQRIERFAKVLKPWGRPNCRSLKMALVALGYIGDGFLRSPLRLPSEIDIAKMRHELDQLGVGEWEKIT